MRSACKLTILTALVAAAASMAAAVPAVAGSADAASVLAEHALTTLDGKAMRLSDLRGRPVLVNFWASWCPPCRKELPEFDSWSRGWGEAAAIVAISIDREEARCRRFVEEAGLALTSCLDGPDGLARKLDLPALPTSYVLDQEGRVVLRVEGASKESLTQLRSAMDGLLAPRTVSGDVKSGEARR